MTTHESFSAIRAYIYHFIRKEYSPEPRSPFAQFDQLLLYTGQVILSLSFSFAEDPQVLLLQFLKVLVESLVPRIEDEDLEAKRRGRDEEICD